MDKPNPVPPVLLFLEFSNLVKGKTTSSLLSRGIPGPLSSIIISL